MRSPECKVRFNRGTVAFLDRLLVLSFDLVEVFEDRWLENENLHHVLFQTANLAECDTFLETRELLSLPPVQLVLLLVRVHVRQHRHAIGL